jgi:hypothetical protein
LQENGNHHEACLWSHRHRAHGLTHTGIVLHALLNATSLSPLSAQLACLRGYENIFLR